MIETIDCAVLWGGIAGRRAVVLAITYSVGPAKCRAKREMEITLLEDPACSWCWAFQPVITAMLYELAGHSFKTAIRLRSVMGGLCDRPAVEASFFARHWQTVAELSGMPFNTSIW